MATCSWHRALHDRHWEDHTHRPLLGQEKAGAFSGVDPKGKEFGAQRMAAAVSELRDLVIEAWRTSSEAAVGYPRVKVRDVEAGKVIPIAEMKGRD
ncbi:MAG TPA: hypothetical protein VGU20_00315 [Stellaceae bacterium]|nr:hypothetical protein [Stellaceae bacterium]